MKRTCRLRMQFGFAAMLVGLAVTLSVSAASRDIGGKRELTYFNANMYVGADLLGALNVNPQDLQAVIAATTEIYYGILASAPQVRIPALARVIAEQHPDVVGVVEAYTLETAQATTQGPGQFSVAFDYLEMLTQALQAAGAPYQLVVVSSESDVTLPIFDLSTQSLIYGRLVDHEAILVRADLPPGHLTVSNPQTGHFSNIIEVPGLGIAVKRGWCSVDVFTRGERLRYVLTHPEEESVPLLNYVQIQQLLGTLADVQVPVILAGDLNSDPLHRNGTVSYDLFAQAGFKDAWLQVHPQDTAGGLTWGHDALLADPQEPFSWRIDLVLYRGGALTPESVEVVDISTGRSQPPLWASDHAAVSGSFMFAPPKATPHK